MRRLCAEAVEAMDWDELQPILSDLRNALPELVDDVKWAVAEERAAKLRFR